MEKRKREGTRVLCDKLATRSSAVASRASAWPCVTAAIRINGWTCTTLLPHEKPSTLDHKFDWAPRGGRSRRQSFAFGRAGPDAHGCVRQLIDMPDSDHRLRPVAVKDARQFSPSAARNCVPIREVLTSRSAEEGHRARNQNFNTPAYLIFCAAGAEETDWQPGTSCRLLVTSPKLAQAWRA